MRDWPGVEGAAWDKQGRSDWARLWESTDIPPTLSDIVKLQLVIRGSCVCGGGRIWTRMWLVSSAINLSKAMLICIFLLSPIPFISLSLRCRFIPQFIYPPPTPSRICPTSIRCLTNHHHPNTIGLPYHPTASRGLSSITHHKPHTTHYTPIPIPRPPFDPTYPSDILRSHPSLLYPSRDPPSDNSRPSFHRRYRRTCDITRSRRWWGGG